MKSRPFDIHRGPGPHRLRPEGGMPPDFRARLGRRARVFESGDLRLLVLSLLEHQPRHGYEVIRAIAELVGGDYSPSPGTVYPTLSLLEDMGHAAAATLEDGRRQYRITAAGQAALADGRDTVDRLVARFEHGRRHARARGVPDVRRAMENLKTALRMRLREDLPDEATVRRIAELIDRTAVEIGRL